MSWLGAEIDGPLVLTRAIHFAASAVTVGALMFHALVAKPALRPSPEDDAIVHWRMILLAWAGLAVTAATGLVWLALQTMSIAGLAFGEAMRSGAMLIVLKETQFGLVTEIRAGLAILLHRRFTNARVSAVTRVGDKVLLVWILVTLLLGLSTIGESASHMDGTMMVRLMTWAQHTLTFRGDGASFVANAPLIFRVHLFMGMTLFVIFPFTRMVHVWSGFASVGYLGRAWQLVRSR